VSLENIGMNVSWFYNPGEAAIHFFIECHGENFAAVELSDVSGKILFRMQAPTNFDVRINVSNLPKGIYFLRASSEYEFVVKKIMIN